MQVKFEFGHGPIWLLNYAPWINFQFPFIIFPSLVHIQLRFGKLQYGYVKGMLRSCWTLVMVWWLLPELCPFNYERKTEEIISFRSLSPQKSMSTKIWHYRYIIGISRSSFNFVIVRWFSTKLYLLNDGKNWKFLGSALFLIKKCTSMHKIETACTGI
jgi:hypothetical protein